MRISPLVLLQIAALLAIAATAFAQAESSATNATCPAGTNRHELDGLLFCIPQSNERYQFTPKGIGLMYWLADDPIEPPADSQSLHDLDVTIIRVWADQSLVGMSDQLSGKKGFDRF